MDYNKVEPTQSLLLLQITRLPAPTALQEQCLAVAQAAPKEQLAPALRQLYRTVGQVMPQQGLVCLGPHHWLPSSEKARLPTFW